MQSIVMSDLATVLIAGCVKRERNTPFLTLSSWCVTLSFTHPTVTSWRQADREAGVVPLLNSLSPPSLSLELHRELQESVPSRSDHQRARQFGIATLTTPHLDPKQATFGVR